LKAVRNFLEFFKRHDVRSKITPAYLEEKAIADAKEQTGRTWADVIAELDDAFGRKLSA
jgi:hypothetical protein